MIPKRTSTGSRSRPLRCTRRASSATATAGWRKSYSTCEVHHGAEAQTGRSLQLGDPARRAHEGARPGVSGAGAARDRALGQGAGAGRQRRSSAGHSRLPAWPCRTSTGATAFPSAAWPRWTRRTAPSPPAVWATTSTAVVRVLTTTLHADEVRPRMHDIVTRLFNAIPTGVGSSNAIENAVPRRASPGDEAGRRLGHRARLCRRQRRPAPYRRRGLFVRRGAERGERSRARSRRGAARDPGQRQPLPGSAARGRDLRRGGRGRVRPAPGRGHGDDPLRLPRPGSPGVRRDPARAVSELRRASAPTTRRYRIASSPARRSVRTSGRATSAPCRRRPTSPGPIAR